MITFDEYLDHCIRQTTNDSAEYFGPVYFKVLSKVHPELAKAIAGTELDPTLNEAAIPAFLDKVIEELEKANRKQKDIPSLFKKVMLKLRGQ